MDGHTDLRLTLKWIVFTDQFGNLVVVDPTIDKPLGLPEDDLERRHTVYLAATDAEMRIALEAQLYQFEHFAKLTPQHRALIEKAQEALDRHRPIYQGRLYH